MDLTLFQFDYDLTFAVFFMNADQTIYGRFGTRSSRPEATKDISMEGFRKALAAALELHERYPADKASLTVKRGAAPRFKSPEEYPSLRGRYLPRLNYERNVVQSCMHCHQVLDAERLVYRSAGKPIPDEVLYPWPLPEVLGLSLDPQEKCKVIRVATGSTAARDGFASGDEIMTLEGQPIISIADVQWVLHNAPNQGQLHAEVLRDGKKINLTVTLDAGWRRRSDIGWRVSTWELRRMGTGGLLLEDMSVEDRRRAGLNESSLALRVNHVGQYGAHAAAKRAGFKKGDIVAEMDGQAGRMTESQFIAYAMQNKVAGDGVPITILRDGNRVNLVLPMQ